MTEAEKEEGGRAVVRSFVRSFVRGGTLRSERFARNETVARNDNGTRGGCVFVAASCLAARSAAVRCAASPAGWWRHTSSAGSGRTRPAPPATISSAVPSWWNRLSLDRVLNAVGAPSFAPEGPDAAPFSLVMAYRLKAIRYQASGRNKEERRFAGCAGGLGDGCRGGKKAVADRGEGGTERRVLLQNENGPCPLLAAANALLLRGSVDLPAHCVRNSVASLEDVTNMLADHALLLQQLESFSEGSDGKDGEDPPQHPHHLFVDELLQHIPKFQYGMDVNPHFTQGITGYEYTPQLTAFDLLRVKLVHGWLVDPQQDETYRAVGRDSYNALVERIIQGSDASAELEQVHRKINRLLGVDDDGTSGAPPPSGPGNDMEEEKTEIQGIEVVDLLNDDPMIVANDPDPNPNPTPPPSTNAERELQQLYAESERLTQLATQGSLIDDFLHSTGHQLTVFGLQVLHDEIQEDELVVFFRNNHFGTLTKRQGLLYLLVTDLGYANTPNVVWEKLDVIDGDTELVNSEFLRAGEHKADDLLGAANSSTLTPEQLLAQSSQNDADYHLALHLSMQQSDANLNPDGGGAPNSLDVEEGQLMAAATEASLRSYHGLDQLPSSAPSANAPSRPGPPPPPPPPAPEPLPTVAALPPPPATATAESATTRSTPSSSSGTKAVTFSAGPTPLAHQHVAVGIPVGSSVSDTVALLNANRTPSTVKDGGATPANSMAATSPLANWTSNSVTQEDADRILALRLQSEHDEASLQLARKLQDEEDRRAASTPVAAAAAATAPRPSATAPRGAATASGGGSGSSSSAGCAIS